MDETTLIIGKHRVMACRNPRPDAPWSAVCTGVRVDGRTLRSCIRQIQKRLYKDGEVDRKLHAIKI